MCATLNHRKKVKAEPIRLIPQKLSENLKLSMVMHFWFDIRESSRCTIQCLTLFIISVVLARRHQHGARGHYFFLKGPRAPPAGLLTWSAFSHRLISLLFNNNVVKG